MHLKHNLEPSLHETIHGAFAQIKHETQSNLLHEFHSLVLTVERINGQMRKWREEDPKPKKSSRLPVMLTAEEETLIKSIRGDK